MKVMELIELLKQAPQDLEVYTYYDSGVTWPLDEGCIFYTEESIRFKIAHGLFLCSNDPKGVAWELGEIPEGLKDFRGNPRVPLRGKRIRPIAA